MHGSTHGQSALRVEYLNWARIEEDLRARLRELDAARWAFGEILSRVGTAIDASDELRRQFQAQGASFAVLGAGLGLSRAELETMRQTAATIPVRARVSGVGWTHHQAVARALPQATSRARKRWLLDAARHGWTAAQLARRLRACKAAPPAGSGVPLTGQRGEPRKKPGGRRV